jgi:histidinol phosphatase-like PHP family hydrolase
MMMTHRTASGMLPPDNVSSNTSLSLWERGLVAGNLKTSAEASVHRSGRVSRRRFLAAGAAGLGAGILLPPPARGQEPVAVRTAADSDIPLLDLHVHLDNSTIDKVLELSRQRGVTFGIVEHAGTKENQYPVVLSNDEELRRYLAMLEAKPVYRGVQAEWIDWMQAFSPEMLARLDYVLTDAMTFPGKDGRRVKLWEKGVESRVEMSDKQAFMDRYVQWYVEIMERQPIDILANVSWLPAPLARDYEAFWTAARVRKVAEAAAKHRVALEIGAGLRLPKLEFLQIAKAAGVKFSFGTNGRYPNMGKIDYCLEMAEKLRLRKADVFTPAPDGQRAVQRRWPGPR